MKDSIENRRYILKIRGVDRDVFDLILRGEKKMETRAGNKVYSRIKAGDTLVFKCGKDVVERKVKKEQHFDDIDSLLKKYKPQEIMPYLKSKEDVERKYHGFPNYDKRIKESGILSWELE